ncbi:MAG TPA: hypothetical protein ENJ21_04625 [Chromatiaceae bacterium]|nr:hypothetical protein [Chromatiaceae bacterium]
MKTVKTLLVVLGAVVLVSCASVNVPRPAGALTVAPREVLAEPDRYAASLVQWGGSIITTKNLPNGTQLEVLAYPLNGSGKPRTGESPAGRFIAFSPSFLDPLEYRSGRLVTVSGRIRGLVAAKVGEADYRYPEVEVESLFLWPRVSAYSGVRPTIHLGVGSGGAFGGIGIGF